MPSLSNHHSADFTKIIYVGDSSTGKTGSLASLAIDGYRVRILDLDNGVDILKVVLSQNHSNALGNVDYMSAGLRDEYKASPMGPILKGAPRAFSNALKALEKWEDETNPAEWGADTILVVDSLSAIGKAAYEWAKAMNPGAKEPRTWYFGAQQAVEAFISKLTSEEFKTNVIVISHIDYRERGGLEKGYVNSVGRALGPVIPRYFNTLILAESSGSGKNVRRKIKTVPTGVIDLKTPNPFQLEAELPLETGLATVFKILKGK